jgi:hypothetical protein
LEISEYWDQREKPASFRKEEEENQIKKQKSFGVLSNNDES